MKEIALNYFQTFSRKDLSSLQALFAEDITLRDWDIEAIGRDSVVAANEAIFNATGNLKVIPVHLYQEGNTVIAELLIEVEEAGIIKVVDVITFNQSGKIVSVRAYKG